MNLPAFCIRRPAFTIVISLVMSIIGLIGFLQLPVRGIPNVTPPEVTINTVYPGANARLVERDVTKVIEDTLSGINGIEMLTSNSRQNQSYISIQFKLGRDMNAAVEDVRSSLERVRGSLPKDVENPVVLKADPDNHALLYISFRDDHRNARELSDYVDKYVVPFFETIDGVGNVAVYGKRISAMQVKLDPAKMAGTNVTVDEVVQLLKEQSTSIPSGQIRAQDRYYSVVADTGLTTEAQFNDLIIRDNLNQVVRLKDIGQAQFEAENTDSAFRIDGKPGVALGIIVQSTANPLDVEEKVQKVFADLKRTLPAGMEAKILGNNADNIRASIHSVYESLGEAVIFVWLVILAFLCSFRATLIPIITIPVCLMSTFSVLYFFNFSINTITLMAFVLAIGLVVDDAIVMLENISRHIESGLSSFNAALKGSGEIVFPIIAMTITLAAVYAPIAFTSGLLGIVFREFTFTLAGAVIISGIVALTLTPMMCARILKSSAEGSRYSRWQHKKLDRLQQRYASVLTNLLKKRLWVIGILALVMALGAVLYHLMPSELAPAEDQDYLFASIAAPRGSSFTYTDNYIRQFETILSKTPDVSTYLSISGARNAAHAFEVIILKPKKERTLKTADLMTAITKESAQITGVKVNLFPPSPPLAEFAGSDEGDRVGLVVMTSSDYRKLQSASSHLMDAIKKHPAFVHVDNKLKWDGEQLQINIDRNRAADLKVAIPTITNTISTLIAGKNVGKTNETNVFVKMNDLALANPNIFQQLYVRNISNQMVNLSGLLNIQELTTPEAFHHYQRLRSDTIFMTLAPNEKLSDAITLLENTAKENLPDDMKYTFTGEAKSFLESSGKTAFTFLLALVFIYLVLVAQFESFIDPLIILFTVPFAMVGALITLKLFGGSLNIYSNIGMITLVGLIAKHGILITDFANRLRESGQSIHAAVVESARLRIRPILMTTAAMVLGAIPLALAYGPGAESRQQVGLVITGGLLFGTFFSLIVVPIIYTYLSPFRKLNLATEEQEQQHATAL